MAGSPLVALDMPQVLRRLAFIRYLHQLGVDQSQLPEPMSAAAVLMFHDAAEHLLVMSSEHLGGPPSIEFMGYWKELRPSKLDGGVNLPAQSAMRRLNDTRVSLKHYGNLPSRAAVEQCRDDTSAFLSAAVQLVFGLDYGTVSMASVIPQDKVRDLAEAADAANGAGDRIRAMCHLADAWMELFHSWPKTRITDRESLFRFGPTLRHPLSERDLLLFFNDEKRPYRDRRDYSTVARQVFQVTQIAKALQAAARLTGIGVDFGEYQRFNTLTPVADRYNDGRREFRAPVGYAPTADDVGFCLQFVVTASLRLAEAETKLVEPPWLAGQKSWHVKWETVLTFPAEEETDD